MSEETKLQPAENLTPEEFLLESMSTLSPEIQKSIDILFGKLKKAEIKIEHLQKQLDLIFGKAPIAKKLNPSIKHGMSGTRIYSIWRAIKSRCFRKSEKSYKNYGGRGITMYPAWIHDFQAFYDYVSQLENYHKTGYTLERINNDGNYEPGNLKWATRKEQNSNNRHTIVVEYQGQKMCLKDLATKINVSYATLLKRHKNGKDLFAPVDKRYLPKSKK